MADGRQMALNMQPNYIAGHLLQKDRKARQVAVRQEGRFLRAAGMDHARYMVKVGFKNDGDDTAVAAVVLVLEGRAILTSIILWRTRRSSISFRSATAPSATFCMGRAIRCEQIPNVYLFHGRIRPCGRGPRAWTRPSWPSRTTGATAAP